MRFILVSLAAAALSLAPSAFAQPTIHPGAQRLSHTMLVESGLMEQTMEVVVKQLAPTLRESFAKRSWYAGLDEQKKRGLDAFVDTFLIRAMAGVREQLPKIETNVAIAYSEDFTAEESAEIADYFGSEAGLAIVKILTGAALDAYASGGRATSSGSMSLLTPEQIASIVTFSETPGGQAFSRIGFGRSRAIMRDSVTSALSEITPAMTKDLRADLCAILGDPCPMPN